MFISNTSPHLRENFKVSSLKGKALIRARMHRPFPSKLSLTVHFLVRSQTLLQTVNTKTDEIHARRLKTGKEITSLCFFVVEDLDQKNFKIQKKQKQIVSFRNRAHTKKPCTSAYGVSKTPPDKVKNWRDLN